MPSLVLKPSLFVSNSDPDYKIRIIATDENSVTYCSFDDVEERFQITRADFQRKYAPTEEVVETPKSDHVLRRQVVIDAPLRDVFDFFSKADNLAKLTPASLTFQILTPLPILMEQGTLIDYRLSLYGVPLTWKTRIEVWEPMRRFVDNQLKGPYKLWWHEHSFEEFEGKTRMTDVVHYSIPGWILEPIIHALFVGPQVAGIFKFRNKVISEIFRSSPPLGQLEPLAQA